MTIYIHYQKKAEPGYTPHDSVCIHNVEAVVDQLGRHGQVQVRMQFSDFHPTHDHVERIVIEPTKGEW